MATTPTWGGAALRRTTDAKAQLGEAQAHHGVTTRLVWDADFALLDRQIARVNPVPRGYIHTRTVDRPTGSDHWLIVVGHTPIHLMVNAPWAELDLISGTTLNAIGRA